MTIDFKMKNIILNLFLNKKNRCLQSNFKSNNLYYFLILTFF